MTMSSSSWIATARASSSEVVGSITLRPVGSSAVSGSPVEVKEAIALRIPPDIEAAVLYSTLSGNLERNSRQLYEVLADEQFQQDTQVPLEMMDRISPMYSYHLIQSPVQMHHGTGDAIVPVSWAVETCSFLESAGVSVECVYYPDVGHVFNRGNFEQMQAKALEFYTLHLSP